MVLDTDILYKWFIAKSQRKSLLQWEKDLDILNLNSVLTLKLLFDFYWWNENSCSKLQQKLVYLTSKGSKETVKERSYSLLWNKILSETKFREVLQCPSEPILVHSRAKVSLLDLPVQYRVLLGSRNSQVKRQAELREWEFFQETGRFRKELRITRKMRHSLF